LERATSESCRLVVESISNTEPHYARTLRKWRYRFVDNFAEIDKARRKDHPGVFDSEQNERSAYELAVFLSKVAM
jgi:cyclopropane-fatty-acyl-phospholipid synthase